MVDRKDYPTEKLQAMVLGMEAARVAADRGSRDDYVPSDFMFAAVEAGEKWDLEEAKRTSKAYRNAQTRLAELKLNLIKLHGAVQTAAKEGKFSLVTSLGADGVKLQREIVDLESKIENWDFKERYS